MSLPVLEIKPRLSKQLSRRPLPATSHPQPVLSPEPPGGWGDGGRARKKPPSPHQTLLCTLASPPALPQPPRPPARPLPEAPCVILPLGAGALSRWPCLLHPLPLCDLPQERGRKPLLEASLPGTCPLGTDPRHGKEPPPSAPRRTQPRETRHDRFFPRPLDTLWGLSCPS